MTQVLTGHGVFGEYLKKIGSEETDTCYHCGEGKGHGVAHAGILSGVGVVPLQPPRYNLRRAIGECLAPSAVVEAMLNGPQEYGLSASSTSKLRS